MTNTTQIDAQFRLEVEGHLLRNALDIAFRYPLILAISGPSGEGKTFQVEHILNGHRIDVEHISSGELESENAGQPAERIRRAYLEVSKRGSPDGSALVIHDFDTAVGDWGSSVQYTVNRQAVFGQLMSLCDSPEAINGHPCRRIPIILTGNNFTTLYGPLVRAGRTRTYHWVADSAHRLAVLRSLLPWIDGETSALLHSRHPTQSVAFWAAFAGQLDDSMISMALRDLGFDKAMELARRGLNPDFSSARFTREELLGLADRLANSSTQVNYLDNL